MTGFTSVSQTQAASFFAIYQLEQPVSTALPVSEQISACLEQTRLHDYNPSAARAYGFPDSDSLQGNSILQMAAQMSNLDPGLARLELEAHLRQFVAGDYQLDGLSVHAVIDGSDRYCRLSYHGFFEDDQLAGMLVLYQDESAAHYQETLVAKIARSLAAESGEAFFQQLAQHLAQTLEMDYALVAEALPDSEQHVKILALYDRRGDTFIATNQVHSLAGTLASGVLKGDSCICPGGLLADFPDKQNIQALNIDSLIAIPILGGSNPTVGCLALMHSSPIANCDLSRSVLNIFSIRVSAEIERRRNAEEKQRRRLQQQLFIDNSTSGLFVAEIDPPMQLDLSLHKQVQWVAEHSRIIDVNPAFLAMFRYQKRQEAVGRSLYNDRMQYDFATTIREFISREFRFVDQLVRFYDRDEELWASANASGIVADGCLVQILGMMTDVTERVQHSQEMEYRAKHDELTGLPNRSFFIDQVEQARRLSTPGSRHALFLLDLDGFKEVNDTLGHEIGDYLLKQIGPRFEGLLPKGKSILARLGGDEFAVFIENYSDEDSLRDLAAALMRVIQTPFAINELELVVGGSIGIALYPQNAESVSSLMRCADVAMYQAKKDSVDYRLYSTQQDHYTVRRLSLMMDIRQAIDNGELRLHFQPIVDLQSQAVASFEALIRWEHPQHGLLAPGEFIPLIEITDMIGPVTCWVIESAIKQLADWNLRNWSYRISVNVSTRNLIDPRFVSFIAESLRRYRVRGEMLEIEITESTLMADPEKARSLLLAISKLGCRISIDDYGTGYSSLGYLKSLPINTLKIDRSFISQMLQDKHDRIIVNSTIQLAHNLGLDVTAEGIEDVDLVASLLELGCDKGQGYFFCRPVPIDALEAWLQRSDTEPAEVEN